MLKYLYTLTGAKIDSLPNHSQNKLENAQLPIPLKRSSNNLLWFWSLFLLIHHWQSINSYHLKHLNPDVNLYTDYLSHSVLINYAFEVAYSVTKITQAITVVNSLYFHKKKENWTWFLSSCINWSVSWARKPRP